MHPLTKEISLEWYLNRIRRYECGKGGEVTSTVSANEIFLIVLQAPLTLLTDTASFLQEGASIIYEADAYSESKHSNTVFSEFERVPVEHNGTKINFKFNIEGYGEVEKYMSSPVTQKIRHMKVL